MSNLFEDHPAKSIVVYTLLIAGATWAVSEFILDENKINFYKAQVENQKALVENQKSIVEQYRTKVELLENDLVQSRKRADLYFSIIQEDPKAILRFEAKLQALESKKKILEAENTALREKVGKKPGTQVSDKARSFSLTLGSAIIDDATGLRIGLAKVSVHRQVSILLELPGQEPQNQTNIPPGKTWEFVLDSVTYKLTLTQVSFITDRADFDLRPVPSKQ